MILTVESDHSDCAVERPMQRLARFANGDPDELITLDSTVESF